MPICFSHINTVGYNTCKGYRYNIRHRHGCSGRTIINKSKLNKTLKNYKNRKPYISALFSFKRRIVLPERIIR